MDQNSNKGGDPGAAAPTQGEAQKTRAASQDLAPWQKEIVAEARAFTLAVHREMGARMVMSVKHTPSPEYRGDVLSTYADCLIGLAVQMAMNAGDDSLEYEEYVLKQVREKFSLIRAETFKARIMDPKRPFGSRT